MRKKRKTTGLWRILTRTKSLTSSISEDEDLIKREVIQGDADLFTCINYLSESSEKG